MFFAMYSIFHIPQIRVALLRSLVGGRSLSKTQSGEGRMRSVEYLATSRLHWHVVRDLITLLSKLGYSLCIMIKRDSKRFYMREAHQKLYEHITR